MSYLNFKKEFERLRTIVRAARSKNIDLNEEIDFESSLYNFEGRKLDAYKKEIKKSLSAIKLNAFGLNELIAHDKGNASKIREAIELVGSLGLEGLNKIESLDNQIKDISGILAKIKMPDTKPAVGLHGTAGFIRPMKIPDEIREEILTDFEEAERCFNAGCFRCVAVLCGRILETALHRKYYEVTGLDALEKEPGIGLGKLVAKLVEKDVKFDPGITQQIHLLNQVRIFSVHAKKEAFFPTKAQAHAMILYTSDIIEKMF